MERINVIAPPGKICPKLGGTGMIDDKTPVAVPSNRYYRRLLAEKSLLHYTAPDVNRTRPVPSKKEKSE